MRFTQAGRATQAQDRIRLRGSLAWLATGYSLLVLLVAFLVPVAQLLFWARTVVEQDFDSRYWEFLWHSLLLGSIAALLTATCALLLAYAGRRHTDGFTRTAIRIATLGYALPGPVLAVGIFVAIAWIDRNLLQYLKSFMSVEAGMLLQGTLFIMLPAYLVRFLAVGFNPIDSAMQRLTRSVDEASRSLGISGLSMLRRVHLPILRGGMVTALTLIFVDVMKEMPITLMTRPFGWDTLAVRIFEMTSEGEWERAALPAVALVLAGLIPIAFLTRHGDTKC
jgi:iron(III) transport system permease protein